MSLEHLRDTWEELGRDDPLWAVLAWPGRRGGSWSLDEFLATGHNDVDAIRSLVLEHDLSLGSRLLDFGCGVGRLCQVLAEHVPEVVGLDIARSMIDEADRINRRPNNVRFVHYDGARLPFADNEFDSVISLIAIQHSPPAVQLACLLELQRVVRTGGVLVLQIPTRRNRPPALGQDAMRARIDGAPTELTVHAGQMIDLPLTVTNVSQQSWDAHSWVSLGNHWRQDGQMVTVDDGREPLPHDMEPGETAKFRLTVRAPGVPGRYELELDMVQDTVAWWADVGSTSVRVPVSVTDASAPVGPVEADTAVEDVSPPAVGGQKPAQMDMFGVDESLVRMLFAHTGCSVITAKPDDRAGAGWESKTYLIRVGSMEDFL